MCREKFDRSEFPADFDQWTVEQQHDHLINNVEKYFPNIPVSLRYVLPAIFKDGDCGRSISKRPDWLDIDKFRRGQEFAQRNFAGICIAHMLSLCESFTFSDGLKVLIMSQKSNTPHRAFQRYLSTILRISHWYQEDPWDESTQAHKDIKTVRKMHLAMRRRLCSYDDEQIDAHSQILHPYKMMYETILEDFRDVCPAAKDLECPYTMIRTKNINQGDMSGIQAVFIKLIVTHPNKCGVHNVCDEDLEAFCHMWRGIGYLLGIEDYYNFCRGNLKEIRTRLNSFEHWLISNKLTITPEWEHMCICVYEGLNYFIMLKSYKIFLLYSYSIAELKMPRFYGSLTLVEKMRYMGLNFLLNYLMRLPVVVILMNAFTHSCINRALNFRPKKHSELRKKSCEFDRLRKN